MCGHIYSVRNFSHLSFLLNRTFIESIGHASLMPITALPMKAGIYRVFVSGVANSADSVFSMPAK